MVNLRAKQIFRDYFLDDTSFKDRYLFFEPRYSQSEVRRIYEDAVEEGIGIGLVEASVEGQMVNIWSNCETEKEKEFLTRLIALYREYGFGLQYHYQHGLITIKREYGDNE